MRRAPARPVRACFVRTCCTVDVQEHDLSAAPAQCNAKWTLSSHFTLQSSHPTLHTCTSSQLISSELFSSHFMSSHMSAKFFLPMFMSSKRSSTFLISLQGLCLFVRRKHHPRLPGDHSLTEDIYELCTLRKQRNVRGNARPSEEDWSSTFQVVGSQVPAQII